jgi:hypothetical protein
MSKVLETGWPGLVGSRMMLRFLAAGREVRIKMGSSRRAAEMPAIPDTGDVQPRARVSFKAADRDHAAGRMDAVAGCEFVDDRIRRRDI